MGECRLDHSLEDVRKKLSDQSEFINPELYRGVVSFLEKGELGQQTLNELFHLLKKYDLADEEERQRRDADMKAIIG